MKRLTLMLAVAPLVAGGLWAEESHAAADEASIKSQLAAWSLPPADVK